MSPTDLTLGQVSIPVIDLSRATAFYRDKVGIPFLFEAGGMSFFDCGGVRLMLTGSNGNAVASSILYYKTDNIHVRTEFLKSHGVTFEQEPRMIAKMPDHELWMSFFKDSEGNLCAFMSEVR